MEGDDVYWWEGLPEPPELPSDPPETTDILIVGAGYAGLSAAIAAADGGAQVTVVDAGVPGKGASTRNGGMFGAHPRLSKGEMTRRFGGDVAKGVYSEANAAFDLVRGIMEREGIDCDFQQTGRIMLAWTRADHEAQKATAENLAAAGVEARLIPRADLGSEIETARYHGGLLLPKHGAIHPRKFHDGLLAAALRRGVAVIGNCAVAGLERIAGGFSARTAKGAIRAEKVLLATNGYTGRAFPWHDRRVFALPSFIIATEPLSDNMIGRLAPGRRMMVETRARHSYYRVSPDGSRILYGGRAYMRPASMAAARARLRATMAEVWPDLSDVRVTHTWTGFTGYTFNHMPQVGEAEGLHFALGFSGSGTVMAPYLGAKAAWRMLGDRRGETAYAHTALATNPLYPGGTPHFLKAADLWYRWAIDPAQSLRARL